MIGKTLGHYQLTEKLGEGGIGGIYPAEAKHTTHQVAFKIPPHEFAYGATRLDRSDRRKRDSFHRELQRR